MADKVSDASKTAPFYVPVIDIGPYFEDPESAASAGIIENIHQACVSTGFFQVVNHGIPRSLQKTVFDAAAEFFALPLAEKMKLDAKTTVGHRGYDVLESQCYEHDVLPDLKEGFFVGENMPEDHPWVKAGRMFMGQNVWPPVSLIPDSKFKEPVTAYYTAVLRLAIKVLEMIARALPYGADAFDKFASNNPLAPMRLLHYPPARATEENAGKRQLGASAHTDFGAITLLLQDGNPGLEVLDTEKNTWVPIEPNEDRYVVNIGDMLSMWTKNEYKSSWHRVLNKNAKDRYSIVMFFDGNLDCPLLPLDGSEIADDVLTVERHMIKRMTMSYGQNKA